MGAFLGLGQFKARAACDYILAVLDKVLNQVLEIEQHGTSLDQRDVVDRERRLQLRQLEQFVQYDVGNHIVTQIVYHADTVLVRLVADVGDADNLAVLYKLGLLLDHSRLVDVVGHIVGNNHIAALRIGFNRGLGSDDDRAASGRKGLAHTVVAVDDAASRKVGRGDILHQALDRDVGVVDVGDAAVQHLAQIVGRHIGSHTDSDTVRAVDKQVRDFGRQHCRLLAVIVVGGHHIDGVFVDIGKHLIRNLLHTGLGVTHCCRAVAVDGAKVTLSVDKRVAHCPGLCQTHHSIVYRRVAVRVVFTQHLADHGGRFLV